MNTADKVSSDFCVTCCAVLCYAWKRVIQIPTSTVSLLKNIHKCNIPTELIKQAKAPEVRRSADISRLIICRVLVRESAVTTMLVSTTYSRGARWFEHTDSETELFHDLGVQVMILQGTGYDVLPN